MPLASPLAKPEGVHRVLLIAPWLQVGGADRFNLDLIEQLTGASYEFTVVTTLRDEHPWMSSFARLTPDVFCLNRFLNLVDYPRFVSYLIESRHIDAVLISNSEFGYALLPYLRARHPHVALLDYNHMEEPDLADGGYPGKSVAAGDLLDLRVANTEHLKHWMEERGCPGDGIEVRRCAVDTTRWRRDGFDREDLRERLGIEPHQQVITFVGRVVAQKRPLFFIDIIQDLARRGLPFVALVVGQGEQLPALRWRVLYRGLRSRLSLLGAQPPERVTEILAATDIFVLPSEHEGLAIALIEAMAMGVIPVAADVGGQSELVTPESGYLISPGPGERQAYAKVLNTLLTDATARAQMSAAARKQVVHGFDMATLRAGIDASFQRALKAAACRAPVPRTSEASLAADRLVRRFALRDRLEQAAEHSDEVAFIHAARYARQRLLPQGSRAYIAYRNARRVLTALRVKILTIQRRA